VRVLITGITGMAGSHLAEFILERVPGVEIYGNCRWRSLTDNIDGFRDRVCLIEADVRDASSMRRLVKDAAPDLLFHLAAQSNVVTSWHAPADTMTTNIIGELNLLEAVRDAGRPCRILIAGSSEEYGCILPHELPVKETNDLRPLSPYAVSKVAQDLMAFQYSRSYGLGIVRTRAFNHTGPRRLDVFVESGIARQLVEIEKGRRGPVLLVGNLKPVRDYTDVRDMVRAYWMALEKGKAGEVYNISSHRRIAIGGILDVLLKISGVSAEVREDPAMRRPYDAPVIYGDSTAFRDLTGWEPSITIEKTLEDILDYWRARI
jgi:GDP-4-dehydro-6-deoxy-D-mannose reductase